MRSNRRRRCARGRGRRRSPVISSLLAPLSHSVPLAPLSLCPHTPAPPSLSSTLLLSSHTSPRSSSSALLTFSCRLQAPLPLSPAATSDPVAVTLVGTLPWFLTACSAFFTLHTHVGSISVHPILILKTSFLPKADMRRRARQALLTRSNQRSRRGNVLILSMLSLNTARKVEEGRTWWRREESSRRSRRGPIPSAPWGPWSSSARRRRRRSAKRDRVRSARGIREKKLS
jgi:hypothetical protein